MTFVHRNAFPSYSGPAPKGVVLGCTQNPLPVSTNLYICDFVVMTLKYGMLDAHVSAKVCAPLHASFVLVGNDESSDAHSHSFSHLCAIAHGYRRSKRLSRPAKYLPLGVQDLTCIEECVFKRKLFAPLCDGKKGDMRTKRHSVAEMR